MIGQWQRADLGFADSNDVFRQAMGLDHVDPEICQTYFRAVVDFGQKSFDRARTLPSVVNPDLPPSLIPFDTMLPGWQGGRSLDVRQFDGRHCILLTPKLWRHPDGRIFLLAQDATSDGASVPDLLASLGLTFWGPWWMAAFLHDCCYRNNLWVWLPQSPPQSAACFASN